MNGHSRFNRAASAVIAAAFALASPLAGATDDKPVHVKMLAPKNGDRVGIGGRGWFVDLAIDFEASLEQTGFTGFQLTGPAGHANAAPFPGTFSAGADDRLPGLVVLVSTSIAGAGSCQNVANLFNLTGVTHAEPGLTQIWDTWIVGAPNFGVNTVSSVYAAIVADRDGDGIFNDAPSILPDADGNGRCDDKDLKAFGIASSIAKSRFFVNP